MVFWLAVLLGALFAWIAVRIGFYGAWIMFFHLLLASYLAIFLAPQMIAGIPAATAIPGYGYALTLVSIAVAALFIGYGTCYACLAGRLHIEFPRFFDTIVAGMVGFLAGFLVWSFLGFAFCLTPLAQLDFFKRLGVDVRSLETNTSYLCWWCNQFHSFVSPWGDDTTAEQAAATLLAKASPAAKVADAPPQAAASPAPAAPPPNVPVAAPTPTPKETPEKPTTEGPRIERQPETMTAEPRPSAPAERPPETKSALGNHQPAKPRGPLHGAWQASTGATFRIDDDGKTAAIDLIASDALLSLTGTLLRRDEEAETPTFTGILDAVFKVEPSKRYTIDVAATLADPRHLRLRCSNWPKWTKQGKPAPKGSLSEVWTRADGGLIRPTRPDDPFAP